MKLNICHLYPDVLNLYSDAGNVLCLKQRLLWRGIDCEVTELPLGAKADFNQFDLFFLGGGQGFQAAALLKDLKAGKLHEIIAAIEDERVFLAICGGFQLLGEYFVTTAGEQIDYIGALPLHTIDSETRMTGNCRFSCSPENGGFDVVGFENHSGKTYLNSGLAPLGKVIKGFGNNGEDGTEGARYKNVFASYSHGPLLPKNPQLADEILKIALNRRHPGAELQPLDDTIENTAHDYMSARLSK
ncbi:MAG: glutamine amidotransferase [Oscillospiraceae bacterium]